MVLQSGWKKWEWRRSFPVTELFNAVFAIALRPHKAPLQQHELSFIEEFKWTFLEKHTEWWNLPREKDSQLQFHAAHNHKICSLEERKKNGWFKENVDWNGTPCVNDSVWALQRCNRGLSVICDKLGSLERLISSRAGSIYWSIYFFFSAFSSTLALTQTQTPNYFL